MARYRPLRGDASYKQITIGIADDIEDADGALILDFREAQEIARRWFDETARGGSMRRRVYRINDVLDDYLSAFSGKSVYATKARVEAILRPELGELDSALLSRSQVAGWHRKRAETPARLRTGKYATEDNSRAIDGIEGRRCRRSTANRDLTVLKAALNHAFREGKVKSDEAWRRVRPFPNVDAPKQRYLTDDEARRLVRACEAPFSLIVQGALFTGARYGDLRTLRVADVDLRAETILVPAPKSGKPYVIYLGREAVAFFAERVAGKVGGDLVFARPCGRPWGASHQARPMEAACKVAAIDRATFHDLRRTYGARLAMQGVPMTVIAEAMGHSDERTTRRHYAHLAPSFVADTVRRFTSGMDL